MKTPHLNAALTEIAELRRWRAECIAEVRRQQLSRADLGELLTELSDAQVRRIEQHGRDGVRRRVAEFAEVVELSARRARDWDALIRLLGQCMRTNRRTYQARDRQFKADAWSWPCGYDDMKGELRDEAKGRMRMYRAALSQAHMLRRAGAPFPL